VETSKIVVDTDIIIDYLKKREPGASIIKKAYLKYQLNVTSIAVYELLYGVQKSGKTALINRLLRYVDVIPFDEIAARKAASIHYILKSKGMDIGIKDSFIVGICEAHNLPLLTRNIKHFNRIAGLKLISIE
jgi:tRNA(fMet)-specific endonuclease VapC